MGGWELILWGSVVATGTLLYLCLVADEIEFVEQDLRHVEFVERKAYKRRLERAGGGGVSEPSDVIETIQAA